jgi:exodeoxyribonuclease X
MDNVNRIVVLDTETTGDDPANGAEMCELGLVNLRKVGDDTRPASGWVFGEYAWSFIETTAAMHPAARAAHHIHPDQVKPGAPYCVPRGIAIGQLKAAEQPGTMLYAAHNAKFDMKFLPELSLAFIDTYQCARHLYPESPKMGNQVLRYHLNAEPPKEMLAGMAPHRALYDAACTGAILLRMLATGRTPANLLQLSQTPVLLATCNFGKHKGQPWAEVPLDYLRWVARENDIYRNDSDVRHTVDHYLSPRQ